MRDIWDFFNVRTVHDENRLYLPDGQSIPIREWNHYSREVYNKHARNLKPIETLIRELVDVFIREGYFRADTSCHLLIGNDLLEPANPFLSNEFMEPL